MSLLTEPFFWLVLFGIFATIEIIGFGYLYATTISLGTLVPFLVSFYTDEVIIILLSFAFGISVAFIFVKPILARFFKLKGDTKETNIDSYVGKVGDTSEVISTNKKVRVTLDNGEEWYAMTRNGDKIQAGEQFTVLSVDGATLVVGSLKDRQNNSF